MDNVYVRTVKGRGPGRTEEGPQEVETRRYYSRLMLVGRRNTPSMGEAKRDLARAFDNIYVPLS